MDGIPWLITALALGEIGAIISVCYLLSQLVGTPDTTNDLSKKLVPISTGIGVIIMVHTLLWFLYFQKEPMAMNLYFLISGSFTMIVSLVALSISLCQFS